MVVSDIPEQNAIRTLDGKTVNRFLQNKGVHKFIWSYIKYHNKGPRWGLEVDNGGFTTDGAYRFL